VVSGNGKTEVVLKRNLAFPKKRLKSLCITSLNINGCISTQTQNTPSDLTNTNFRRMGATKTVYTVTYSTSLV
jgi:hypothetical protein